MRVLKLCTSDELTNDLPDELRAYRVAERVIAERTGETVETVLQQIWPTDRLPDLAAKWNEKHQPDVVLVIVSPFWMTFESVPLALRRRFGRVGAWVGDTSLRVGGHPRLSGTAPVRMVRSLSLRLFRGAYHFTPEEVAETVEGVVRQVLRREGVEVVVRGPLVALGHHGNRASLERAEERRARTDALLSELCERLHLTYVQRPADRDHATDRDRFEADLVHTGAAAHRDRGEMEGAAVSAAWLRTHGSTAQA